MYLGRNNWIDKLGPWHVLDLLDISSLGSNWVEIYFLLLYALEHYS
jgi:hypothetical protein